MLDSLSAVPDKVMASLFEKNISFGPLAKRFCYNSNMLWARVGVEEKAARIFTGTLTVPYLLKVQIFDLQPCSIAMIIATLLMTHTDTEWHA